MKSLIFLICLTLCSGSVSAQSVEDLDKKYGFRDIALGSNKDRLRILGETPLTADHIQQVKLARSDLTLNGLPLESFICELFNDKVVQIRIYGSVDVKKGEAVTRYMDFLEATFGKPTTRARDSKGTTIASEWQGDKVILDVFERTEEKKDGSLKYQIQMKFTSIALANEMKKYAEKIKTGAP